jgi:hypothetical protein
MFPAQVRYFTVLQKCLNWLWDPPSLFLNGYMGFFILEIKWLVYEEVPAWLPYGTLTYTGHFNITFNLFFNKQYHDFGIA